MIAFITQFAVAMMVSVILAILVVSATRFLPARAHFAVHGQPEPTSAWTFLAEPLRSTVDAVLTTCVPKRTNTNSIVPHDLEPRRHRYSKSVTAVAPHPSTTVNTQARPVTGSPRASEIRPPS